MPTHVLEIRKVVLDILLGTGGKVTRYSCLTHVLCLWLIHFLVMELIFSGNDSAIYRVPWCRHHMEAFSALLALCAGNSPVTGEFPSQKPVTRSFDVFFDLRLNKRLGKQSQGWWFETTSCPLWRHCNGNRARQGHHSGTSWQIQILTAFSKIG